MDNTKRISRDKSYQRPEKTYQDTLTNQEIKEKLKEYKKVANIQSVSIGTHIRYFVMDKQTKERVFRLGGILNKVDPEGRFIILSNGTITWSVQIPGTLFYQKMSEDEYKEEVKKEIKKEIMSEVKTSVNDNEIDALRKEIKNLNKKLENYKELEKEYKNIVKKNEQLSTQITQIQSEVVKNKSKK